MDSLNAAIVIYLFGLLVVNGCDGLEHTLSIKCEIFRYLFEAVRNTVCILNALDEIRRMAISERIQFRKVSIGTQYILDKG